VEAKKENSRTVRARRRARRRSPLIPYIFGCSVALFSIISYNEIHSLLSKRSTIPALAKHLATEAREPNDVPFQGEKFDASLPESAESSDADASSEERSQGKVFDTELQKLKRYEAQLHRRVQSLDMLLGEIERLDNGSMDSAHTGSAKPMKGSHFGGGDVAQSAMIHLHKNGASLSDVISKNAAPGEPVTLLLNTFDKKLAVLSRMPIGAPLNTEITSGFGWRSSAFSGVGHMHTGVDFSVERRTPIVATADGVVVNAGPKGAYGNAVMILHGNGLETLYGHLDKITVRLGEKICRGETLGFAGSTGRSTGPHLHYEVRVDGEPRDPRPYIELASFAKLLQAENPA